MIQIRCAQQNTRHCNDGPLMGGLFANDAFRSLVNADCAKSSTQMTLAQKIALDFATACAGRIQAEAHSSTALGCKRKKAPSRDKSHKTTVKSGQAKPCQPTQAQAKQNEITDDASTGQKRKQVPKKIKEDAWFKYVGRGKPDVLCICCRSSVITPFSFHAGHVTSCKQGGATIVENIYAPQTKILEQKLKSEFYNNFYPPNEDFGTMNKR